jgi:hypothetical protein
MGAYFRNHRAIAPGAAARIPRHLQHRLAHRAIETAKLNGLEPMARLTDVLERIVSGKVKANALEALLPWNWRPAERVELAAAA